MRRRFLKKEVIVDTDKNGTTEISNGFKQKNEMTDYLKAKVIDVGDEVQKVKVGQEVVFITNALNEVSVGKDVDFFVREENVIYVIENKE